MRMRRLARALIVTAPIAALPLGAPGLIDVAHASTLVSTTCAGPLAPGAYGNVIAGAGCVIDGSETISGNVTVGSGGTLTMTDTTVGGNLQANGATALSVEGSIVNANVAVQNSPAGVSVFAGNTVRGNLQVQVNASFTFVEANTVGGNLQAQRNTGGGLLSINSVGGNCGLQGNSPAITGLANTAGGNNTCNAEA
ncbi:MAG: hypothetical protein FWC87_02420 [Acidimicrobiaceae bacterium]|nr:hypothetical protein [Acidimicrobiaceae bacterium]